MVASLVCCEHVMLQHNYDSGIIDIVTKTNVSIY